MIDMKFEFMASTCRERSITTDLIAFFVVVVLILNLTKSQQSRQQFLYPQISNERYDG